MLETTVVLFVYAGNTKIGLGSATPSYLCELNLSPLYPVNSVAFCSDNTPEQRQIYRDRRGQAHKAARRNRANFRRNAPRVRCSAEQEITMQLSSDDERCFWTKVWPPLQRGTWRYELRPFSFVRNDAALAAGVASRREGGQLDVDGLSGGSCGDDTTVDMDDVRESNDGTIRPTETTAKQNKAAAIPSAAAAVHAQKALQQRVPVFFPPARGEASEALEEAIRRQIPADGSAGEDRLNQFEGIDAMIELLTQVPGFPGTTSLAGVPNMDNVARVAEAVSGRRLVGREGSRSAAATLLARAGGQSVEKEGEERLARDEEEVCTY